MDDVQDQATETGEVDFRMDLNFRDTISRGDLLNVGLTENHGQNAMWQPVGGSRNRGK